MARKKAKISWFNAFSHKALIRYLTLENEIVGAVNNLAGYVAGDMEMVVDGFSEIETDEILEALEAKQPLYMAIGTPGTEGVDDARQVYKIIHATESAGVLNKIWVFPKLQETAADDAVITILGEDSDGWDEYLDLGVIGEQAGQLTLNVEGEEIKDETGATYYEIVKVKGATMVIPMLDMTKENFIVCTPNVGIVGNDTDDSEAFDINSGDYDAPIVYFKAVPRDNTSDTSRTIVLSRCVQSFKETTLNLGGSERTKTLEATFKASGDRLVRIGDESAAYVHT